MTLKIEITVPHDEVASENAASYLEKAVAALGFYPSVPEDTVAKAAPVVVTEPTKHEPVEAATNQQLDEPAETAPIRYHGQAGEGRKRRTKEEIALDEEAAELLEKVGLDVSKLNAALDKAEGDWDAVMADLRAAAAPSEDEAKPNISTGEARVDPENPDDDDEEPLTHEDVRDALGRYAAKFGMPAAQENGPRLLGAAKISAIPDDQTALRKAVDALNAAIEKGKP